MKGENFVFLGILLFFSLFLVATINDTGITYDELLYFDATLDVVKGILGGEESTARLQTSYHGSFMYFFASMIFIVVKDFLDITTALRLGTSIMYILFLCIFFFWTKKEFGGFTALVASIVLMGMPQVFFHSHLLALDFPVMVLYFLSSICFYYAVTSHKIRWILASSVCLGAMLATKVTGYFIFVALFLFVLYKWFIKKDATVVLKIKKLEIPLTVIIMVVIFVLSGLGYLLLSPKLRTDPLLLLQLSDLHHILQIRPRKGIITISV